MMKEEYKKPQVVSNGQVEGVVPAAVVAAFPALVGGVAMGTQIKKMLNGNFNFQKMKSLLVVGEA